MGMQCRYAGVNNSAWAKSSSEADGYFYVFVFDQRKKDGTH